MKKKRKYLRLELVGLLFGVAMVIELDVLKFPTKRSFGEAMSRSMDVCAKARGVDSIESLELSLDF